MKTIGISSDWAKRPGLRTGIGAGVALAVVCGMRVSAWGVEGTSILNTHNIWRQHFVWGPELVHWKSGDVTAAVQEPKKPMSKMSEPPVFSGGAPAENWASVDFDDGGWVPSPGPIRHAPYRRDLAVLYLRGVFHVADPGSLGGASLSMSYRGGAVVYVNGKEVARKDIAEGPVSIRTHAEPYPESAYAEPAPKPTGGNKDDSPTPADPRIRSLSASIPAESLRKGMNVLAVEIHRAPVAETYFATQRKKDAEWSMLGFHSLEMTAKPGGGGAFADAGVMKKLVVWVGNPLVEMYDADPGEVRPALLLSMTGARNGAFSGVVVVRSAEAVQSIKVEPSDLTGEGGKITASGIQVRYAVAGDAAPQDSGWRRIAGASYLGVLEEKPALPMNLPQKSPCITLPVWLTVRIPKDAKAGEYKGEVTVAVNQEPSVTVPVTMRVADFVLPDPREFASCVNLMQSPESVALQYNVPLWSEEHWKLLDRTFSYLGGVGVKCVHVPVIGRTNEGNEYTMVRWIKQADGSWKHDFSAVERYLDMVIRHLGKVPVVCILTWTATHGGGGFGKLVDKEKNDTPMVFTVLDPATGEMKVEQGPDWGTPASQPFWKPVYDGLKERLAARGMEKAMALGIACDRVPSKQALADLQAVAPDAGWVMHAHGRASSWGGKPLAVDASVWGIKDPMPSTSPRRAYGWKNKVMSTVFPRYGAGSMGHVRQVSPIGVFHAVIECYQASGYNGIDRVGVDYWPVVKDAKGKAVTVVDRFPKWDRPGAPTMGVAAFLAPGKEGALATVRFEALRLGVQETEARIAMEKILLDKAKVAKAGTDLAKRAQVLLDERVARILDAKQDRSVMYSIATDASWLGYAETAQAGAWDLYSTAGQMMTAVSQ